MQVQSLPPTASFAALTDIECVAELLARESVTLVESEAYGSATGVFAYRASDLNQVSRTFVGLLMLDESVALASLTPEDALRVADLIEEAARAESGRTTKILDANRPWPAVDALGFEYDAETLIGRSSLAIERLRAEDGYPAPGVGLWYESGDVLNQPGDDLFGGGYSAVSLDQAATLVTALRAAVL